MLVPQTWSVSCVPGPQLDDGRTLETSQYITESKDEAQQMTSSVQVKLEFSTFPTRVSKGLTLSHGAEGLLEEIFKERKENYSII